MKKLVLLLSLLGLLAFFQNCSEIEFEAIKTAKLVGVNGETNEIIDPNDEGPSIVITDDEHGEEPEEDVKDDETEKDTDDEKKDVDSDRGEKKKDSKKKKHAEENSRDEGDLGLCRLEGNNDFVNLQINKLSSNHGQGVHKVICVTKASCEFIANNSDLKVTGFLSKKRCGKNKNAKVLNHESVRRLCGK